MMLTILAAAVGIASASQILPRAPAAPEGLCCFTLTASADGIGGAIVEEDTIGQNRVYSTYPDGYYCINPAEPGKLYDQGGRTCIISKTSQQFQCTQGLTTEVDFTVNLKGDFQADGSDRFWACRAEPGSGNTDDGSYLIYTEQKENPYGCVPITLSTTDEKCAGHGDGPVSEAPSGSSTTTVSQTPTPEPPLSTAEESKYTSIPVYGKPISSETPSSFITSTTVTDPASSADPTYSSFDIFSSPASSSSGYVPVENEVPQATPSETSAGYPFDTSILPLPTSTTVSKLPLPTTTINPSTTPASDPALLCPPLSLIPGFYRAPALIIPVSPEAPDTAYRTQYVAQITPGNSSLFSFDIPADWEGSSCSIIFTFPATQADTAFPEAWKFAGDGKIRLSELKAPFDQSVTFATTPEVKMSFEDITVVPGGEYRLSTEKCRAGSNIAIKAESCSGASIEYFQATGPKAIGVWITRC